MKLFRTLEGRVLHFDYVFPIYLHRCNVTMAIADMAKDEINVPIALSAFRDKIADILLLDIIYTIMPVVRIRQCTQIQLTNSI